jgi:hypothetical protein
MDFYYDLKKMLCRELEEIARRKELSAGDLEVIDKLTHSIKSIVTIMAMEDSGYSYDNGARRRDTMGRYNDGWDYDNEYSGRRYYDNEYSGRRYSRDEAKSHMVHQFEKLMDEASSQGERDIIQSALNKLKNI